MGSTQLKAIKLSELPLDEITLQPTLVDTLFRHCLFNEDELVNGKPPDDLVEVEGITMKVGLHPGRVKEIKPIVETLLEGLHDNFFTSRGGGWSFVNLPFTNDGRQWGEQSDAQVLMMLGIAIGRISYTMPKDMWKLLPGGVPYIAISDKEE